MSATISAPWILDFLISVAEEYGGNLSAAPPKKKAAKAQLVKFLTFPDPGDTAPCNIWVEISDKKHIIHARLSQDAVARHLQHPLYAGKPITSHKSALVLLRRVRVAFGRVPNAESKGMSRDATLFLDVEEFELKGSFGEAMWDSPVEIANDKNIRDWIHGLRQDGGAGNVLKQRKEHAVSMAELAKKARTTASESHMQTTMDAMNVKVRVARKSGPSKPRLSSSADDTNLAPPVMNKEALRKASWKRFHTKMVNYFCPPDEVLEHLFTLCGERLPQGVAHNASPKRQGAIPRSSSRSLRGRTRFSSSPSKSPSPRTSPVRTPESSPPRSPSNWSSSDRGSPNRSKKSSSDTEEELEDAVHGAATDSDVAGDEHVVHNTSSTKLGTQSPKTPKITAPTEPPSLSMPPPLAQPPRRSPPSSVPYATSSPQLPVQSQPQPSATAERNESLPPSSLLAPVSSLRLPPSPTSSPQYPTSDPAWSASGIRRVPPPQVGTLLRDPDASGEGRVLVENSDTASPGSQRVALSQSQSQSQNGGSQELGQSSQSQRPSKLRNEVGPVETQGDPRTSERPTSPPDPEDPAATGLDEGSQESAKSRQSLSYKGDSQSQDKPAVGQQAPDAHMEAAGLEAPMDVDGVVEAPNVDADNVANGAPLPQQTMPSAAASPIPADTQGAPHAAAAPTWAAIRSTSSPEDEGDSEDDVDELLSDPLAFEQATPARPRQTRSRKVKAHVATNGKERLDSDDERTAAMIDRYAEQTNQVTRKVRRSRTRKSPPGKPPQQSTPAVEDHQPPDHAPKRRRKEPGGDGQRAGPSLPPDADVFTSEGSLREEPPEPSSTANILKKRGRASPALVLEAEHEQVASANTVERSNVVVHLKPPAHDPSVWSVPTFMRKGAAGPSKGAASKKRTAGASLSNEVEGPASKKRKTQSAAIPVSSTATRPRVARNLSAVIPDPSMTQSHSRETPAGSTHRTPEPSHRSVPCTDSKGVKYVDLRAVSRSASRSSSRASRAGSGGPRPTQVTHQPNVVPATSSRSKPPIHPVKREAADTLRPSKVPPVASGAKFVSSQKAKQPSASESRRGSHPQPGVAASRPGLRGPRDAPPDVAGRSGNEYRASLQQTRTFGGPPLVGWDDLLEILLETGRARTEAIRASDKGTGSESGER